MPGYRKKKVVSFSDIIVTDMSSYYYTGSASETKFDGEGQLSSAVNYVTSDVVRKIYQTSGHGETTLSSTIQDLMDKNNYTLEGLNTVMNPEIPDDCELLLMYAPTSDLTADEKNSVESYLKDGGKMMLLLGDTNSTELPNLASIMKTYGMESQMVLLLNTHGMTLTDPERDSISTTSFMTTSDNAYAVTEDSQSQAGSYVLGAVAVEDSSRFTVISAGSLIASEITDTFPQLENTKLFMNAVAANFDGAKDLSIEAKSLTPVYNTMQHAGLLSLLVIFILPLGILLSGFAVWMKRRKA